MTTFTTTINSMYAINAPDPDYVVNVIWTVTGVNGDNTTAIGGNTQFNPENQESSFIPYSSLTEAKVIDWIPANQIESAQACVQGQIDSMITPFVSPENTPLPWTIT